MTRSLRTSLTIALLAITASTLGAPLAHASSLMHSSGDRSTIHSQERFRLANRHLPYQRQAPSQQRVEDPFADLILG
ncbi:hypothetical protein AC629_02045 [Bradyrhizobium sp. NAS80.1]|uniref:hypothetical protein n=1 Tax=Bradyrhizobium sp. NAS80.1 TaxID=1680159 RepID=UPI00096345C9|nr:hypothetical protein [Bradyrhizobium sp. NAS80.1]OKO91745.1 hypothetical protein AC629_02045 [Bradyrhizobium sp. NAS80.1]